MAMTMNRNNRLDKAGDTPSFGDSCQCETILQFSGKPCGANICLWCSTSDNSCSESHCNLSSLSFYPPQASHSRWCDPNQSEKRSQNFKAKKSIGSENLIKKLCSIDVQRLESTFGRHKFSFSPSIRTPPWIICSRFLKVICRRKISCYRSTCRRAFGFLPHLGRYYWLRAHSLPTVVDREWRWGSGTFCRVSLGNSLTTPT